MLQDTCRFSGAHPLKGPGRGWADRADWVRHIVAGRSYCFRHARAPARPPSLPELVTRAWFQVPLLDRPFAAGAPC